MAIWPYAYQCLFMSVTVDTFPYMGFNGPFLFDVSLSKCCKYTIIWKGLKTPKYIIAIGTLYELRPGDKLSSILGQPIHFSLVLLGLKYFAGKSTVAYFGRRYQNELRKG